MKEVQKKSAVPVYIAAGVFILYSMIFPLYSLIHFFIAAVITAAAWLISDAIIKPEIIYEAEDIPVEESFGEKADAILSASDKFCKTVSLNKENICDDDVKASAETLCNISDKIAEFAKEEGADYSKISRFQAYYLPVTEKLLQSYAQLESQGVEGTNISGAKENIINILKDEEKVFAEFLDSLFSNKAVDIDTEIQVMNMRMEREGLSGPTELDKMIQKAAEDEIEAEREKARLEKEKILAEEQAAAEEAAKAEAKAKEFADAENAMLQAAGK